MRTILFIIQKEFLQVFRNKTMLPLIFVLPIVQLIILVNAATLEMKNIDLLLVDKDLSGMSRRLGNHFKASGFFRVNEGYFNEKKIEEDLLKDEADVVIVIPCNFEKQAIREGKGVVQVLINAINGPVAGISQSYVAQIISGYNKKLLVEWFPETIAGCGAKQIVINPGFWFNPELNYQVFMVPAVIVILVTIIGMFLTGLNIVREKEMGTIEQVNVTPVKKYQFITGKLVPFWIIALFELAFGLFIGKLLFKMPIEGSLWLLFGFAAVYLLMVMGFGLFLSIVSNTQQQAMVFAFFFMLVFVMMSGVFTSVESMPEWAQKVNLINPIAYFMKVIRMILLKGSGFWDVAKEFFIVTGYGIILLALSVFSYRKVV
ncbi:MAG: ABC transporter permease [Bacteroidota bacterium]